MTTILDDVLLALEETAAEKFSEPERAGLLMSAHNMLARQQERDQEGIVRMTPLSPQPAAEIDNREDPEE